MPLSENENEHKPDSEPGDESSSPVGEQPERVDAHVQAPVGTFSASADLKEGN